MRIPLEKAKRLLAILWFGMGLVLFMVMVGQSFGYYGDRTKEAWDWFLPNVVPTLTLIIGVLVSDAQGKSDRAGDVDLFIFRLALGLSAIYLAAVALTVFVVPFVSEAKPLQLMKTSNDYLVPLQGLVSAALGAFFVNKR